MGLSKRMSRSLELLRSYFAADPVDPNQAHRDAVTKAMPICAVCERSTNEHEYIEVAAVPLGAGKLADVEAFSEAFENMSGLSCVVFRIGEEGMTMRSCCSFVALAAAST